MALEGRLTLRTASIEDAEMLREWRNDREVRAASRNTAEVEPEEHMRWLGEALGDPDCDLLIVELDGEPIGQVRFDRRPRNEREISVSLREPSRRRGLGAEVIRAGVEWTRRSTDAGRIVAEVRADNEQSLRAFRKAGFSAEASPSSDGFVRLAHSHGG